MATILILGGGFGGVPTARRLRELLPTHHEILLIDQRDYFMVGFRKTWALLGDTPMEAGRRSLFELEKAGIRFLQGAIEAIDPKKITVTVDGERIKGDAMVVALGADLAPESVPGFQQFALNVYDPAQIEESAAVIANFRGGKVLVGVFGKPYKCPPAPYELAILLKEKLDAAGTESEVEVFSPLPATLPILGDAGCATLDQYLDARGVRFHPNRTATAVEMDTVHFEDGSSLGYDLLLGIAPHRPPAVVRESGLTGDAPWIKVGPDLETAFPNVYAIGDVTALMMANGNPLPKAGVFAQGEGLVAAERIAARILGQIPQALYDGRGGCFLEVGGGKAVMVDGHFLAEERPQVSLTDATEGYMQDKFEFEKSRLDGWFS